MWLVWRLLLQLDTCVIVAVFRPLPLVDLIPFYVDLGKSKPQAFRTKTFNVSSLAPLVFAQLFLKCRSVLIGYVGLSKSVTFRPFFCSRKEKDVAPPTCSLCKLW